MKCECCGKEIFENEKYCTNCGASITENKEEVTTHEKKVALAAVLSILAVVVLVFSFAGGTFTRHGKGVEVHIESGDGDRVWVYTTDVRKELTAQDVESLRDWSFDINADNEEYNLFFELCDEAGNSIRADVSTAIRIVNDNGDIVYEGTHEITKEDYVKCTDYIGVEQDYAYVRIAKADIMEGTAVNGKVYFVVSGELFAFNENSCHAWDLPVKSIQLNADALPVVLSYQDSYDSDYDSKICITDLQYTYKTGWPQYLYATISGDVVYGSQFRSYEFKVYDSEGYPLTSGSFNVEPSMDGKKFKEEIVITSNDFEFGGNYTISFLGKE